VIADAGRPDRVRDLAFDIAIACETREVASAAANLALDSSAAITLRATAARAVGTAGNDAEAARLVPLALGSEPDDKTDDLKGNALQATWRTIEPLTLFASLSRAKRPNWAGAYRIFLGELAESLSDEHVVPGLYWIERLGHAGSSGERELEAAVIIRAFRCLDDPEVREPLVRLVRRRLRAHEPLIDDREERSVLSDVLADPIIRHRLLTALVDIEVMDAYTERDKAGAKEGAAPVDPRTAMRCELDVHILADSGYLAQEDFIFILDSLARVKDALQRPGGRLAWGELARVMLDAGRADHVDAVLERALAANVHETFRDFIEPVDLHGAEAQAARRREREREAELREWADLRAKREHQAAERAIKGIPLPSADRLAMAARTATSPDRADDLPQSRWIKVYFELVRDEHGNIPIGGRTGDVRAGIAWRDARGDVRSEVIEAAATFVALAAAPELDADFDVHHHVYAWAGYIALRLLSAEAPNRLDRLGVEVWRRWAPTVALAEPYGDAVDEHEAHIALVRRTRDAAQEMFDAAVLDAVDHAIESVHWRIPRRVVTACANSSLGADVLARCLAALEGDLREATADGMTGSLACEDPRSASNDDDTTKDKLQRELERKTRAATIVELLKALLQGGSAATRASLVGTFEDCAHLCDLTSPEAERALIAGQALLAGAEDAGWSVISTVVEAAPDFAKELFLRTARDREFPIGRIRERLGVRGVGELFVALTKAFPNESDPWHNGVFTPGARDNVATWRRGMLNALEDWGSPEAISELQQIRSVLPRYEWLGYSVTRAREQQGRAAWGSVSSADLFALADNHDRRLVRNGDELVNLVVESLGRYQRELQGDPPSAHLLWIPASGTKRQPREESALADDIVRHLRRDLTGRAIAANLEVVLRRGGKGRAAGRRTDIYVTATLASGRGGDRTSGELVTLVIEVKGSWHRKVLTAMRTQLVEGYLREHAESHHGIYVVGCFTCDAWVNDVHSRRSRQLGGVPELKACLDAQAEELSQDGLHVRAVVLDASLPAAQS